MQNSNKSQSLTETKKFFQKIITQYFLIIQMKVAERQRALSSRQHINLNKNLEKSRQKYYETSCRKDISHQEKIYNRNFFLRQAYKAMVEKNYETQIKQLANSQKLDPSSSRILKQKIEHKIQKAVREICALNEQPHQQQLTFQQMCQIIFRTNEYLRKAENALDVEQFFSQLWLYLKNYQIETEYLDANIFSTFVKILMDPKGIKPAQIKQLMMSVEKYKNSHQLQKEFIQKYPQLEDQLLDDTAIFKLWHSIRQKYNLFYKNTQQSSKQSRKSLYKNQFTFQPQISENSRIYAQKSLKKYLSSNKLTNQKNIKYLPTNEQQNQLHQYLSHKAMGNSGLSRNSCDSLQKRDFSYHDLLYKRRLQKEDIIKQINFDESSFKDNMNSRRAPASQIQQIVDKMYYVPEKRADVDYKTLRQEQQLKNCTFHPNTLEYHSARRNNVCVNGFEKQVSRLKKGRQQKQRLKETYENLGRPKNTKCQARIPSFIERDTPRLILEVNIGGGRVEKIKLQGNEDAKIVAKKFINKHSLQNSMLSVLEELIDQNLKNL